jgi:hypothetical protein
LLALFSYICAYEYTCWYDYIVTRTPAGRNRVVTALFKHHTKWTSANNNKYKNNINNSWDVCMCMCGRMALDKGNWPSSVCVWWGQQKKITTYRFLYANQASFCSNVSFSFLFFLSDLFLHIICSSDSFSTGNTIMTIHRK